MAKTLIFSMAIDIQREEVLLPTDRRGMTTKTNVNRTNKPSTKTGHLQSSNSPLPFWDQPFSASVSTECPCRCLRNGAGVP